MSILAMVDTTPSAAASGGGKSGGKGKSSAADGSYEDAVRKAIPVIVNIDRRVNNLEDRSTFVFVIKDDQWKAIITKVRDEWKKLDKERRGVTEGTEKSVTKAAGDDPLDVDAPGDKDSSTPAQRQALPAHKMGGSQRTVIFKCIAELAAKEVPGDHPQHSRLKSFASQSCDEIEKFIFRAKPKHYNSAVGKPWVWSFLVAEGAPSDTWAHIRQLYDIKHPKFFVSQQLTQDGPGSKWLTEWVKGGSSEEKNGGQGRKRPNRGR